MDFVKFNSRPKPKPYRGQPLCAAARVEVKLNGHRLTIVKEDGRIWAVGRDPLIDLWPQVFKSIAGSAFFSLLMCAPDNTAFDGELYFDGPETSVVTRLKEGAPLTFSPFAIPVFDGVDLRFKSWREADAAFDAAGIPTPQTKALRMLGKGWRGIDLHAAALDAGVEGFVIKEHPYFKWWKSKPVATVDAIVVGSEPGKGKHRGKLGALKLQLTDGTSIGSVGTGNDEAWRGMGAENVLGLVVEVGYEGLAANGKLKFPRFMRWRPDKGPLDCPPIEEQC